MRIQLSLSSTDSSESSTTRAEWLTIATTVEAGDVVSETTATAAVRANAVSLLTIIPERAPLMNSAQITSFLAVMCIVMLVIILQLTIGVPIHSMLVGVLTCMAGVDGPSHGYYLAQSTNSTGAVIEMSGLSPMAVFAGSSMLFTMLAMILHCLLECGFYDSFAELLVRVCRAIGRVPRVVRRIAAGIGVSMVFTIMILLLRGVDGRVIKDKVARTRALVVRAPMPESVRRLAVDVAVHEHDVAFMPNYLSRADTVSLAGSLGIPVFNNSLQIDDRTDGCRAVQGRGASTELARFGSCHRHLRRCARIGRRIRCGRHAGRERHRRLDCQWYRGSARAYHQSRSSTGGGQVIRHEIAGPAFLSLSV